MKLFNIENYKTINSNTCGKLTEVMVNKDIPVSITLAENLLPTTAHAHKKSTEIFWLIQGNMDVEIIYGSDVQKVSLSEGSVLVIEPGEFHRVTSASKENKLTVLASPAWTPDDECQEEI